jgi:hypothetical protein
LQSGERPGQPVAWWMAEHQQSLGKLGMVGCRGQETLVVGVAAHDPVQHKNVVCASTSSGVAAMSSWRGVIRSRIPAASSSGSGIHSPTYLSRLARAEPSRSRQMRLATVVSQPPGIRWLAYCWRPCTWSPAPPSSRPRQGRGHDNQVHPSGTPYPRRRDREGALRHRWAGVSGKARHQAGKQTITVKVLVAIDKRDAAERRAGSGYRP